MPSPPPRVPVFSVLATVVLIAVSTLAMLACGSSGPARNHAGGSSACQVGAPIEQVKAPALPKCTAHEEPDTAYSYNCTTPTPAGDSGVIFVIFRASTQLYGRPGGHWQQAASTVSFDALKRALHC
jgi:hypothetical protein